jgi:hypothetical protein
MRLHLKFIVGLSVAISSSTLHHFIDLVNDEDYIFEKVSPDQIVK